MISDVAVLHDSVGLAGRRGRSAAIACISGLTPNIDHSLHIVGQHLQAHLGSDLFEGPGQEVGGAHPCLERAERMLDGLPADAMASACGRAWLASRRARLVLPTLQALDLVGGASRLERAGQARCEVAIVIDVIASVRAHLSLGQVFSGGTGVAIVLGVVDEVRLGEEAALGVAGGLRLGDDG